jgi:molecular chaperone HtpG
MYLDPLSLYKEYIQNAVDSLDEAREAGLLQKDDCRVTISVDRENRQIVIEDNGIGVHSSDRSILLNIGASDKPLASRRGFRGIGRLVGLGYSREMIFETSSMGESMATGIVFDCEKLSSMLVPGRYDSYDLLATLRYVTDIQLRRESKDAHYFRVILNGVDESVLGKERIINYISQVAPLPYNPAQFSFGREIADAFAKRGLALDGYDISVKFDDEDEHRQLYKLYADTLVIDKKKDLHDETTGIVIQDVTDESGNLIAMLWHGNSNLIGSIANNDIKGLRLRKGNMQIGDRSTLNLIFKEERFNGWFQGEVFVLDNLIIPNARRDSFEINSNYETLISLLEPTGTALSAMVKRSSTARARLKPAEAPLKDAKAKIIDRINQIYQSDAAAVKQQKQPAGRQSEATKYQILNLTARLTVPEQKLVEKVFDILIETCPEQELFRLIGPLLSGLAIT